MFANEKKKTDKTANHKDGLAFIKEVAKYFMDFLETDFHKRRNPKRSVQLRNSSNLLTGLNLNRYPSFNALIWKAITRGFDRNVLNVIIKGAYRTNIPKHLLNLTDLQSEKINAEQISEIVEQIGKEIEKSAALHSKEYDQALTTSLEAASKVIKSKLVLPLIGNLEKPLENLSLGDENDIYLMEEELTAIFVALLENKLSEILKLILAKTNVDVLEQMEDVFEIEDIKSSVKSFFENFQVGDLFSEIYEMERNRTILDKQEFYLYFCDITFKNDKYPIFYIPFSIGKQGDSLTIEFDSQVYINKKALEYITQEYNRETNHHGTLQSITERIIYLAQHKESFADLVRKIMNEIINFFGLDKNIDVSDTRYQSAKNLWVRVTNACYIALFDKADEALVNDYEEILKLLAVENSVLAGAFNQLIDDFIRKNPQPFNLIIEEEWDAMDTSNRLVFNSPIPLNGEQRQILAAIRKELCKYIIVEGPPGTGKSHTITAIAFEHILENKSVLVLSDKKEALDVVEDKITETLNKVRYDKNFQNPILRLGKTGSTYSQILATPAIEDIKTHLRVVKRNRIALESDIEKSVNSLKEDLQLEILAYSEINLKEIQELIQLEYDFEEKGFPLDISEAIENPESANDLEELRSTLEDLKEKLKDCKFDFNPRTKPSASLMHNLKSALSHLEKFQTQHDKFFFIMDIRDNAVRLHKDKIAFSLDGNAFSEIENSKLELSLHGGICNLLGIERPKQFADVDDFLKVLSFIKSCIENLNSIFGPKLSELSTISAAFSDFNYKQIQWFIDQYEHIRLPVIGYLFRGKQVSELNAQFKKTFRVEELVEGINAPHKQTRNLKEINLILEQIAAYRKDLPAAIKAIDLIQSLTTLIKDSSLQEEFNALFVSVNKYQSIIEQFQKNGWYKAFSPKDTDELKKLEIAWNAAVTFKQYKEILQSKLQSLNHKTQLGNIENFLNKDNVSSEIELLKRHTDFLMIITENFEDLAYVTSLLDRYPKLSIQMKIDETSIKTLIENELLNISNSEYSRLVRYLSLRHALEKNFSDIPALNYAGSKRSIEELVTAQMTYLLDNRLINFYENNKATAKDLRDIIRSKRRFPRDEFLKLKEAFPCILAGIRDYAESHLSKINFKKDSGLV